jgi:hypothetical protein
MKNCFAALAKYASMVAVVIFLAAARSVAAPKTQAALSLREPGGARAAALAESFSDASNDITAMV